MGHCWKLPQWATVCVRNYHQWANIDPTGKSHFADKRTICPKTCLSSSILRNHPQKISKTDKEKQKEYEGKRERRFLLKWQSGSQRAWLTYKKGSIVGNTKNKSCPGQLYELCLVNIVWAIRAGYFGNPNMTKWYPFYIRI